MQKLFFIFAASKLSNVHPVTALLSRRHMDLSFDRALRQTIASPHSEIQPDVPLSLLPEITTGLMQTLSQHGAILQLPPKPHFTSILVSTSAISLTWDAREHSADVSSDRTLTFSLHCYGDIPHRRTKITFKKRLRKLVTPESGFEDMSETSSESKSTFGPSSLPPSLLGSRTVSMATPQEPEASSSIRERTQMIEEESEEHDAELQTPHDIRNVPSFLPEPIRLPKRREDARLPQLVVNCSANASLNIPRLSVLKDSANNGSIGNGNSSSSKVLNLPPLIVGKSGNQSLQLTSTSGVFGDSEEDGTSGHMSTVDESERSDPPRDRRTAEDSCSSSLSELSTSNEVKVDEYSDLGRFCQGFAFDEIYCGEETSFQYSGLVTGASYFFRVRCHNAAGWGPWSDTAKCMTALHDD